MTVSKDLLAAMNLFTDVSIDELKYLRKEVKKNKQILPGDKEQWLSGITINLARLNRKFFLN